jgi:hypothetical protein
MKQTTAGGRKQYKKLQKTNYNPDNYRDKKAPNFKFKKMSLEFLFFTSDAVILNL